MIAHKNARFLYDTGEYEGEYQVRMNGKGKYVWKDGRKYTGQWQENRLNGFGTYTWPDGRKYQGEWKDNQIGGVGFYVYPDDKYYIG